MNLEKKIHVDGFNLISIIKSENHNQVYKGFLEDKTVYLKVYNNKNNFNSEIIGISTLEELEISTSHILKLNKSLTYIIFEEVKGSRPKTKSNFRKMGEILKKIHDYKRFNYFNLFEHIPEKEYSEYYYKHFLKKYVPSSLINNFNEWKTEINSPHLTYVHSDYRTRHVLFDENVFSGVIDLEYWDILDSLWDLGITCVDFEQEISPISREKRLEYFFEGYNPSKRDLHVLPFYYASSLLVQAKKKLSHNKSQLAIKKAKDSLEESTVFDVIWQ